MKRKQYVQLGGRPLCLDHIQGRKQAPSPVFTPQGTHWGHQELSPDAKLQPGEVMDSTEMARDRANQAASVLDGMAQVRVSNLQEERSALEAEQQKIVRLPAPPLNRPPPPPPPVQNVTLEESPQQPREVQQSVQFRAPDVSQVLQHHPDPALSRPQNPPSLAGISATRGATSANASAPGPDAGSWVMTPW